MNFVAPHPAGRYGPATSLTCANMVVRNDSNARPAVTHHQRYPLRRRSLEGRPYESLPSVTSQDVARG